MKYLITGSSGFIGSHLVEYLVSDGVKPSEIRLLVPKRESLKNLPKLSFEIVRGDIRDINILKKITRDVDVIYHLAAVTRDGEGDYLDVNWRGTKNLIQALKNRKIKKFVFFSSIAIYGLPAFIGSKININEKTKKRIIGDYAKSKYLAEEEVIKANKLYGLPYAIIRPTTVYGPRDKAGIYQLYKAIKGRYFVMIGDGKNKMDYVYVDDLVRGARKAEVSTKKTGDYILGSGRPVTFREIAGAISDSLGANLPGFNVPMKIGIFGGYVIEKINKIFSLSLPFSSDRVKVMTSNYYFDISKAKKEIGYEPKISLNEGMEITIRWLEK